MVKRPLLRLKPREGRRVRAGAPWIFANEIVIDDGTRSLPPGALVEIEGDDGRKFGVGYYNANSLIAVRLFEEPPGASIDCDFFATRIARSLALRTTLFDQAFYRLVHAEGDHLPGLAIDRFGECCTVQISTAGMEMLEPLILEALEKVVGPDTVVMRADSPARGHENLRSFVRTAKGVPPTRVAIEENGTRYFADILSGQKTGWYFDQRGNRGYAASLARGRSVLDVYCHSGGFALATARAGAREVNGLDSSTAALALAEEGAAANAVSAICRFVQVDAMEELKRLASAREMFGIVICDPPPFVKSRKDLEPGARAYRKLARLGARVTEPGGFLILASCSHNMPPDRFRMECAAGIARAERRASLIREAGSGSDHPIHPMLPETAYLKVLTFALE